jgi:hypothetical protein
MFWGEISGPEHFSKARELTVKPKVLVCVLCGTERTNWINPVLMLCLVTMARDPRFDVAFQPVSDHRPFEYARNKTIALARDMGADWVLSFDNDNYVDANPLDVIAQASERQDVIGLSYGVGAAPDCRYFPSQNHGAIDGAFREELSAAGGVLMVRKTVWEKIPRGPWFKWQHAPNELLEPDFGAMDEVTYFCNLVQQQGFKVWTHRTMRAGHLKTAELGAIVGALQGIPANTIGAER